MDKRLRKQVSVALCTYNGAEFIVEQLKSIEAQTLKPVEVLVVDDGSVDETVRHGLALSVRLEQTGSALPGYVEDYLQAAQKSGRVAFVSAVKYRIGRPGFLRNLIFFGLLLKGGYLKHL